MKEKRVLFRADGDLIAGYGHIIRTLALASMLKKKYTCVFISRQPDPFLKDQILKNGNQLIELPQKNSGKEAELISKKFIQPDDIVVLDGYHFNTDYQKTLKATCFKLICIDDLQTEHYVADAIINHSEGIRKSNFSKAFYTKLYLGTPYAILRPSFLKPSGSHSFSSPYRVFMNMGGTDQANYTAKALKMCLKQLNPAAIDIVTGSYYPHKKQLQEIATRNPDKKITLHSNLTEKEICSLMKKSAIGICSASTVSYEYASVGGLLLIYKTVDNQKNIYAFFLRSTIAFSPKQYPVLLELMKHSSGRKKYMENKKRYFGGNSAKNIRSIFEKMDLEREIVLRTAKETDTLLYFNWANDAEVRNNAMSTAPIPLNNHIAWFTSRLKNKQTALYVFERKGKPIGQVRLDKSNNEATIDYSIDKNYRGKGFGEIILKQALLKYRKDNPKLSIFAFVKKNNTASNHVFLNLNFQKRRSSVKHGISYENYVLEGE